MSRGGGMDAGPRLATALLVVPRTLRADLWTVAADPLPPMAGRWLARLPHVLMVAYAVLVLAAYGGENWPAVLLATVQVAAIVVALFRPLLAWWVVTLAMVVGTVAVGEPSYGDAYPWSLITTAALAAVLLLLALRVRPRVVVEALVISVLVGLVCAGFVVRTDSPDAGWLVAPFYTDVGRTTFFCGVAAVLGAVRRARRVARDELAAQQQISAEERARRTLLEERALIARELHDVVAHQLSVISIQAQVAPHLVQDPTEELKQNLAGIRGNALEALAELRRVLGVLRVADTSPPDARPVPQPTLDQLDELVDNVRQAGLSVTTQTTGRPRPLPPGVELSAYRIIQEALSNAMRHAPGAAVQVAITYQPASLVVRISNTQPTRQAVPSQGPGHGLLGMRERVAMLDGQLTAGPSPDGGYEVTATMPAPTYAPPSEDTT